MQNLFSVGFCFPLSSWVIHSCDIILISDVYGSLLGYGTEHDGPAPTQGTIMLVQAGGGIFAGATASCITTPLDTIKTRLQVCLLL